MKIIDTVLRRRPPSVASAPMHPEVETSCFKPGSALVSQTRTMLVPDALEPTPGSVRSVAPSVLVHQEVVLRSGTRLTWDKQCPEQVTMTPRDGAPVVYPSVYLRVGKETVTLVGHPLTQIINGDGTCQLHLAIPQCGYGRISISANGTGTLRQMGPLPVNDDGSVKPGPLPEPTPLDTQLDTTPRGTMLYKGFEITPFLSPTQITG